MKHLSNSTATMLFFLIPTVMLILGFLFFPFPLSSFQENMLLFPLFVGLILLGCGYIMEKTGSLLKTAGWIIFSFYWATQPSKLYHYEGGDVVNAVICAVGVYVLFYFAYKEWLNTQREDRPVCLNWVAGATAIAGLIYFTLDKISFLRERLIHVVAQQSTWFLTLFSDKVMVDGDLIWFGYHYDMLQQYGSYGATAQIIFACTAIQSMLLFIGMIGALRTAQLRLQAYALLATVPVIYVLNLIRNAGVIFLSGSQITTIYIAHHYLGKFGSLIVLIALVFIVFKILPDLYNHIVCLFDLPRQDGPVERQLKRYLMRR